MNQGTWGGTSVFCKAAILQQGRENYAEISQGTEGAFSSPNEAIITQNGVDHEAFILQAGSNHTSTIAQQGSSYFARVIQE